MNDYWFSYNVGREDREGAWFRDASGATAHAAVELGAQPANAGKTIVCVFADTGQRYLAVEGLFAF